MDGIGCGAAITAALGQQPKTPEQFVDLLSAALRQLHEQIAQARAGLLASEEQARTVEQMIRFIRAHG